MFKCNIRFWVKVKNNKENKIVLSQSVLTGVVSYVQPCLAMHSVPDKASRSPSAYPT